MKGVTRAATLLGLAAGLLVARVLLQRETDLSIQWRTAEWLYPARPAIQSIALLGGDSALVSLASLQPNDSLRTEDGRPVDRTSGNSGEFALPLLAGRSGYRLVLSDGTEERFTLEYVSPRDIERAGLSTLESFALTNSTLGRPGDASDLSAWFAPARPLIAIPKALDIPRAATGEEDLRSLFQAYVRWSGSKHGIPSDAVLTSDASRQLALLDADSARGVCGVFSQTLLALARNRGHAVRIVLLPPADPLATSHATLEVFWPERRRWQVVDPTLGFWSVEDASGRPLTAHELHLEMSSGTVRDGLRVQLVDPGTGAWKTVPYRKLPDSLRNRVVDWFGVTKLLVYYDRSSFRDRSSLADALRRTLTAKYGVHRLGKHPGDGDHALRIAHSAFGWLSLIAAIGGLGVAVRDRRVRRLDRERDTSGRPAPQ